MYYRDVIAKKAPKTKIFRITCIGARGGMHYPHVRLDLSAGANGFIQTENHLKEVLKRAKKMGFVTQPVEWWTRQKNTEIPKFRGYLIYSKKAEAIYTLPQIQKGWVIEGHEERTQQKL